MTLITNGPWRIRPAAVGENSAAISYSIDNKSEVIACETHADLVLLRDALTEYLEIVAAEVIEKQQAEIAELAEKLAEVRDMAARFDTFSDSGRTRAFVGDIARIAQVTQ